MKKRRFKEKRPIRLGCMQVHKVQHSEPSYVRLLIQFGFLPRKLRALQEAWGMWQRVCEDPLVRTVSVKQAKAKNLPLPSVAAPYANLAHVLSAMSEKQLNELRARHAS